jgi:copper(I)-binding protein
MIVLRFALVGVVSVLAACGGSQAERVPSNVVAVNAWASATDEGAQRAFVYVTLTADADDELIGVAVPPAVAKLASVASGLATESVGGHLGHLDGDGAPGHTHGAAGIALTKGVAVELQPGAGRIILDELPQPLRPGDTFTMTLHFASGASVDALVTVEP